MEHNNGFIMYKMFKSLHRAQLESSGVPDKFWPALYKKLINNVFDAGDVFSIFKIDYDDDEDNKKTLEDPAFTVLVTKQDGINCEDSSQIYLIDHAWTYECNNAVQNLTNIEGLLERMCRLMNLELECDNNENIENVFREMWHYNQTYSPAFGQIEKRTPLWYIMDEFGSAIEHSDTPNFRCVPFLFLTEQITYSLLFPIKNVSSLEKVTRDYLEGPFSRDKTLRKALMLPWKPSSFLEIDFRQAEPDKSYFMSHQINETLPNEEVKVNICKNRVLKVYSEYEELTNALRSPRFEIVESSEEADILWLMSHFKDYKSFREEFPCKFINQFPHEGVLTIKNLLSVISRRKQVKNTDEFADNPRWCPTTYDLTSDLTKFVSYYQHREKENLDNYWICKPWNLARGLDTIITDNINCIVRLPSSGPKLAQKYMANPVLFDREDVGKVKFDIRYVILLKSVSPLEVYAYRNFFLRFANKPYELNNFWDKERHYTVMNYNEDTPLFKMLCDEFVEKFNLQNPSHSWDAIEKEIFRAFKELFEAATVKAPPFGIGPNEQSRALYAIDLILSSEKGPNGHYDIQPKILEVNWMPDCERACQYYPSFFDDIFMLLFKDDCDDSKFQLL